jgi:hypothetical protein
MPRQVEQLPADATSLARKVAALERQMTELRAARRMGTATVGRLRIYSEDGQTLLAELGPTDDGGGGLTTYGNLGGGEEIPVVASLTSGELNFQPAQSHISDVPARVSYDTIPESGSDLQFSSGSITETDWAAVLDLNSSAGGRASVLVNGFRELDGAGESGTCDMDVAGILTASSWAYGTVSITPSAANVPTSQVVSGLDVEGSTFYAFAAAQTAAPGSNVTGVGTTAVTSGGLTVWVTRTNTTATVVNWMVIGL